MGYDFDDKSSYMCTSINYCYSLRIRVRSCCAVCDGGRAGYDVLRSTKQQVTSSYVLFERTYTPVQGTRYEVRHNKKENNKQGFSRCSCYCCCHINSSLRCSPWSQDRLQ